MKDIYELLNDVDIDENEMESMEVSEFEKEKVRENLKKSLKKNKGWKKKGLVAAALCCAMIGSVGVVGITNPAYAAEILIVGDIFRFLDNDRTGAYDKYKDYADVVGITQESNGVKITIKEAIFDGRILTYTYEIKSDKDLGENPFLSMNGPSLTIKDYNGGTGGHSGVKKVADNTYVGQDTIDIDEERKAISFELNFRDIGDMGSQDSKKVNGIWNFKINLKALDRVKQSINKKTEKNGVKLNIESISKTPVSFTLDYSQEISKELQEKYFMVEIPIEEVKDDLGNIYTGEKCFNKCSSEGDMMEII